MVTTAALFGALFAVLIVMELVDAVLSSVLDGAAAAVGSKAPRSPAYIVLILMGWLGSTVGLFFHELMHAAGQLAFGGRPSIVMLKNGGFAQSSPWMSFAPFKVVHVVGQSIGMGIIGIAPALATAAVIGGIVLWASPLSLDSLAAAGRALAWADDRATVEAIVKGVWRLVADGHWWMWPLIALVLVLVGPCMTPSTVDYAAAAPSLVGYGIGAVLVTRGGALGVIIACGGAAVLIALLSARKLLVLPVARVLGAVLLATPVLWLLSWLAGRRFGQSASLLIQSGLAVTTLALALAAVAQLVYVALALALALLGKPVILWRALKVFPRHVLELVLPFSTCTDCGVHYRKRCDGCGRTPDAPAPPKPEAVEPEKKGLVSLLERARPRHDAAARRS
ncbi:MAG TPA: hypothetical protein VM261_16350 [Kofleriaceae bacterium]|nr:hypothetical protein [Kofleriaceae bacterium]